MLVFGSFDSTAALANAIAPHADLHLIVPREAAAYVRTDVDPRVTVEPLDLPRLRHAGAQVAMCRRLVARVRRIDPDVVHLQQGHPYFNFALPWLRRYPLVVTVHEVALRGRPRHSRRAIPQAAVARAFRVADRVVVHGHGMRPALAAQGVDPERVHVCSRALPVLAGAAGEDGPGDPDAPQILFFGRIWPYKGLEHLIRAEPFVSARFPGVRFVIAGEGESLSRYMRLMEHPERFDLRNYNVPKDERDRLFAAASVVALPYVYATTSAVVPFAQMHARPVVASAVGGLPEAVAHGRTGLLVPPGDPRALADALVRLLADPALARSMGRAGRAELQARSAPEIVGRETLEVYAAAATAAR
jgi:glycosyltransferase involved in cell wall biosynthesis